MKNQLSTPSPHYAAPNAAHLFGPSAIQVSQTKAHAPDKSAGSVENMLHQLMLMAERHPEELATVAPIVAARAQIDEEITAARAKYNARATELEAQIAASEEQYRVSLQHIQEEQAILAAKRAEENSGRLLLEYRRLIQGGYRETAKKVAKAIRTGELGLLIFFDPMDEHKNCVQGSIRLLPLVLSLNDVKWSCRRDSCCQIYDFVIPVEQFAKDSKSGHCSLPSA